LNSIFPCNPLSLPTNAPKTPATSSSTGKNAVIPEALLKTVCTSSRLMSDRETVRPTGVEEMSGSERVVRNGDGKGMICDDSMW
jgi:hypothetical protein